MTLAEAQEHCRYWQKRLRLQDWDVQVEIARHHEMAGNLGDCDYCLLAKCAKIRLLDPADIDPTVRNGDMRHTIIHEILHLHFAPFYDADNPYMEQAINLIAGALCDE